MRTSDFRSTDAGFVHRSFGGIDTFVPALPRGIEYDRLALPLSKADAALSDLSGVGRLLPNPHLLIGPYLRQEAVLSSRIEGTRASLTDVFLDDAGEGDASQAAAEDREEVRNYVLALEHGLALLRSGRPITLNFVLGLHAVLMHGVRGGDKSPGRFRAIQNWIGGSTPEQAAYVPPPPELLAERLAIWERFVNERDTMPDLVQCAVMHEHFEAIHPFVDGNGRIGRLLVTLFLLERERLSQPLLYLSSYIDAHRRDYYDRLQAVRTDGDWTHWLLFFLTGVEETANRARTQTVALVALREELRNRTRDNAKATQLVDFLFLNPYVSVQGIMKLLDIADPTARRLVRDLETEGILTEASGRRWRRHCRSDPIARILLAGIGQER